MLITFACDVCHIYHAPVHSHHLEAAVVDLAALWLPILLSAVIVFVASSIMHMVLPYHRSDYVRLPDEDKVRTALRGLDRGRYIFPHCTHDNMKSPEVAAKYKEDRKSKSLNSSHEWISRR